MRQNEESPLRLQNGSHVAVMGGGPAGSFFAYFLLQLAHRAGLEIQVEIYEPRDFNAFGPAGCNMCGGIISESLVQTLAAEGISLPPTLVQRGIDSYSLHMDVGSVLIETPLHEKRIAAVYRGSGPRGVRDPKWQSLDGFLQSLALDQGAHLVRARVNSVTLENGRPHLATTAVEAGTYDLLAVAAGVNTAALRLFEPLGYVPPRTTQTLIREYHLGDQAISRFLGSSMHVFMLGLPGLQFAALIPKGDFVTACMLGNGINDLVVESFFDSPEVRGCMPPGWHPGQPDCHCSPRINVAGAPRPFGDRLVFIGDCGVTRLYKDGIGAAYREAKAAAATAVFEGISAGDWERRYWPTCRKMEFDNQIGKFMFAIVHEQQKRRYSRQGILKMVAGEQEHPPHARRMSTVLWDIFTGSASYRQVFLLSLHPLFQLGLLWSMLSGNSLHTSDAGSFKEKEDEMFKRGALGRIYHDGETIVRQGERGDCMYVIQEGQVEIWNENSDPPTLIRRCGKDEFIGEMAIFNQEVRSATVRARGEVRVLTVDRSTLLRRIHADPSLAFRMLQQMSSRLRELSNQLGKPREEELAPTHTQTFGREANIGSLEDGDARLGELED